MAGTTTIVFTDLTGSTSTTARLGDDAYAAAFGSHVAVLRGEVDRHGGRVSKLLGDGIMALFESAYEAVRAAVAMQQAAEWAARHGDGSPSGLRIGVNVGEVVDSDDDVFGMAVVLARRLCDAAESDQVLVSDLVRMLVGNRSDLTFDPAGPRLLKGIEGAVTAWTVPWSPRPDEMPITVVVADDAALIRAGIVRLLSDAGFVVTADVGDAEALLAAVDADPPNLVVTDIRMPPSNTDEGLRAAATIRSRHRSTAVLVLSQHVEARAAAALLDDRPAGIGYLLKERVSELDDFLAAAHDVAAGGSVIDPIVTTQLLRRRRDDEAVARLSDRERDVLELMAQGKSNAAIAETLTVGTKTVETHVHSIFQKLDLGDSPDEHRRVLAVVRWLQAG